MPNLPELRIPRGYTAYDFSGEFMPDTPLLRPGDEVVVKQIKLSPGEFTTGTQWFRCPIVGKIMKCLGNPVYFELGTQRVFHHSEYEVAIHHPIRVRGREEIQERFYMVLFEDIEADQELQQAVAMETALKAEEETNKLTVTDPFEEGDFYL